MVWAATAVAGATLVGSIISSNAAGDAADTQARTAQAGIDAQYASEEKMRALLAPYNTAGTGSLLAQQNLLGLNGNEAQLAAINGIKTSSQFNELKKAGEDSILQNASATGGLRGGNVQGALAQFSPALLNSLINDQYVKLGGITTAGQNSAAQTGMAGMNTANSVANLLGTQGQAIAGGQLAQGNILNNALNTGANLVGNYSRYNMNGNSGLGGFGNSTVPVSGMTSDPTAGMFDGNGIPLGWGN